MASIKLFNGKVFPILGLGTYQSSPGEVGKAIEEAVKVGYRHIDGAYIYQNEAEIGKALKHCFDTKLVKREEMFIVTKLWCTKHRPEDVKPALLGQLKDLQLSYVDLYLIHAPIAFKAGDELMPVDKDGEPLYEEAHYVDTWKAMEKCVDEGLVRSIGLSNFNSVQIKEILDIARIRPAVHQVEIHPYFQQEKMVKFCQERNIAVTGYSNFSAPGRPWQDEKPRSVLEDKVLLEIGKKHGKSAAQVVLRWLVQRRIAAIPKSTNTERIKHNFQVFDFELSKEDMELIKTIDRNERVIDFKVEVDGKMVPKYRNSPYFSYNIEF